MKALAIMMAALLGLALSTGPVLAGPGCFDPEPSDRTAETPPPPPPSPST